LRKVGHLIPLQSDKCAETGSMAPGSLEDALEDRIRVYAYPLVNIVSMYSPLSSGKSMCRLAKSSFVHDPSP